ncbi:MAG: hypothetical protein J1E39_00860 [Eubacterium sp.]|nr:hypothetical protein [Eubacterium sp.]
MSDEIKKSGEVQNETNAFVKVCKGIGKGISGFFKTFTGPKHPVLSIIIWHAVAALVMFVMLSFISGNNIVIAIMYGLCFLIPLTYLRPLKAFLMIKSVGGAVVVAGLYLAISYFISAIVRLFTDSMIIFALLYIVSFIVLCICIFAVAVFAYRISLKQLPISAVILFFASILADIIYMVGLVIVTSNVTVDNVLEVTNAYRVFGTISTILTIVFLNMSIAFAARHAQKESKK